MPKREPAGAGGRAGLVGRLATQQRDLNSRSSGKAPADCSASALPLWDSNTLEPLQVIFRSEHTGWKWSVYSVSEAFANGGDA